jgi:hypothetical protein
MKECRKKQRAAVVEGLEDRRLLAVPDHLKEVFFAAMEDRCRASLFRDGVLHADYRRLRVTAVKPFEHSTAAQ